MVARYLSTAISMLTGRSHKQVDFFNGPYSIGHTSRALIDPQYRWEIEKTLIDKGMEYSVEFNDIQSEIDKERRKIESDKASIQPSQMTPDGFGFFQRYRNFEEITAFMKILHSHYSNLCSPMFIGKTYKENELRVLRIGTAADKTKPAIWISGATRGREWITITTAIYIAFMLLTNYQTDPDTKKLVDNFNWFIMPVYNPDGYEYTHTTDRLWRKNLSPIPDSEKFGVDLDRNFGYMWKELSPKENGTSHYGNEEYPGNVPFSEHQNRLIAEFLDPMKRQLVFFISLRSNGGRWLTPYGKMGKKPSNYKEMKSHAEIAIKAMQERTNASYSVLPVHELNPTTGIALDWASAVLNVRNCYTLQIQQCSTCFETPIEAVPAIGEEIWHGIKTMLLHFGKSHSKK